MGSFFGNTRNRAEMMGLGILEEDQTSEAEVTSDAAAYEPSGEEIKLLQWVNSRGNFGQTVKKAIHNFIYRKSNATLDVLSITQLHEFKQKARALDVSLER